MMDREEPLPPGMVGLEEGEQLMAWFSSDEDDRSHFRARAGDFMRNLVGR
jgi:hypothetical protein